MKEGGLRGVRNEERNKGTVEVAAEKEEMTEREREAGIQGM
jgi:hypothetical protein